MPTYAYTARDDRGSPVNGTIEADSVGDVSRQLRAAGKYPVSVRPAGPERTSDRHTPVARAGLKVPRADIIHFAQQLGIMIETGVTLSEALECIASQSSKPMLRKLVEDLSVQVQSGVDFSSALGRHPRSFPRIFVSLVRAAEKSGMLSKLLNRAVQYLRDEQETMRRVKGALTYPAIMLGFAVTTTIFLLAFVLPRFTTIYANKGAALPLPTKILMAASGFVVGHWIGLIIGTAAAAVAGLLYFRTRAGTRTWHFMQLHIPLIGAMYRKLHLSRGLRMIGTMAGAGVNLVDCVSTAHDLCSNTYFREMWEQVSEKITAGKQMSEPLRESPLVPRSVAQMIHSAEKGGKLALVTEQVAGYSEQELKETIADLTRYIEPAMIILMGALIGGVALALMLPIFSISKVVAQ